MPLKISGADGPIKPVLWAIDQPEQLVGCVVPRFLAVLADSKLSI